jgi:hypothetical protein
MECEVDFYNKGRKAAKNTQKNRVARSQKIKKDKFGYEKFQKTAKFSNWNKAKQRQNFQRNLSKHINNISLNLICFVAIDPKWA